MDKKRYGALLRSRREAAGLSAAEVSKALGLDSDTLNKRELGKQGGPPDVAFVNKIADIVPNCSVLDQLVSLGYKLSLGGLTADELAVVEARRRMSPFGQRLLAEAIAALEPLGHLEPVNPETPHWLREGEEVPQAQESTQP